MVIDRYFKIFINFIFSKCVHDVMFPAQISLQFPFEQL